MDPKFFRKYIDILREADDKPLPNLPGKEEPWKGSGEPKKTPRSSEELDAAIKDLTPDLLPVTPDEGDDRLVAYTTPKQARNIAQNPDAYRYGTDIRKDTEYNRPLVNRKQPYLAPRGYSDFSKPEGMDTDINSMPSYPKKYDI